MSELSWIDFFTKFATVLTQYKDRQKDLITKIKPICEPFNPKWETDGKKIDPFTVFGLFNGGHTDENRFNMIHQLIDAFGDDFRSVVSTVPPFPNDLDGIPSISRGTNIFSETSDSNEIIDGLWTLFIDAQEYADQPNDETKEKFIQAIPDLKKAKKNAKKISAQITRGLFWIRPNSFLSLDTHIREYLRSIPGKLPDTVQLSDRMEINEYLQLVQFCKENFSSLPELSIMAYDATPQPDGLQNKFEQWLRDNCPNKEKKTDKQVKGYVNRHVKRVMALDGQAKYRKDSSPWYGLMVLLTRKSPDPIGTVFSVHSLKDFEQRYEAVTFLLREAINDEQLKKPDLRAEAVRKEHYPDCDPEKFTKIFMDLCTGPDNAKDRPDHGFTKAALNKYMDFLNDPKTFLDDGSGSADSDTKSPDPQKDQDKSKKLSEVLVKALSECEEVPEFLSQSKDLPAFLRERQKIWFGAPGTGKSFKVNKLAKCLEKNGGRCFRTTFHPDYDYATFVGCYKPVPAKDNAKEITYEFVPQVFTKAYVAAWKSWMSGEPKPVALVIEEINRGNCAQIFGQIFQLLDRNKSGYSEFPVTMDQDLLRYLLGSEIKNASYEKDGMPLTLISEKKGDGKEGNEEDGVLVLPPNFFIFATMNTSDQSLFPMDSAFKRRWGWEYVPIDCSGEPEKWNIEIVKKQYSWKTFLEEINKQILKKLKSPDKQLGERFVKADADKIDQKTFVNKVMFYLVGDAFKDDSTIRDIWREGGGKKDDEKDSETEIVFADFADETKVEGTDQTKGSANLECFFEGLHVKPNREEEH